MPGYFISFEGTEGCGKSTHIRKLAERLQNDGHTVCVVREPGGSESGEQIRQLLKHGPENLTPEAELLLMNASRAQLVREIIRPAFAAGEMVLPAHRRLRPQDIGVLSSIGIGSLPVISTPRVRIVVTGDELLPAGTRPRDYQITDANSPMLSAMIQRDGGEAIFEGIVADQPEAIENALKDPADVILVSGGSSVGLEDHAPRILAELGTLSIHGIAIRPSSPTGMGLIGETPVFLLPGNPVSCLCAYDFFAGRAIRRMAGLSSDFPYPRCRMPLSRKLVSAIGRVDYARVAVHEGQVEPLAISGASILSSTTRASGFVIIDQDSEGMPAGTEVEVFLYEI